MKQSAIFAAGCFWGVQFYFDQVPGVVKTEVGYIGGSLDKPSYEMVCSGKTGHAEAVRIDYDPTKVSYQTLLKHFFRMHDPTQLNRQGPDVGEQYRSAVFYLDGEQKLTAYEMIRELNDGQRKGKIMTTLEPAGSFLPAEDYHQRYFERTGRGVCHVPYEPL